MGLFCVAMEGTVEDDIRAAIGNLKLFQDDKCQNRSDYLLDFAERQISDAKKRLGERNE